METMKKKLMMLVLSLVLCVTTVGQFSTPVQAEEEQITLLKLIKGQTVLQSMIKTGSRLRL